MKYLLSLMAFFAIFSFTACMDDDDSVTNGNVSTTINFRAEYDDTDLSIQSITYDYPTGPKLKATLFQYYISDLELLPADGGAAVRLADIDLIRYQAETDGSVASRTYDVPAGDYVGLRFGLGVKPELNAMDPNEFSADFVLNEVQFWNANARYVFAKIEANADLENDGTFDTGLTYHLGSDALYTTITFDGDFAISSTANPELDIVADVLKALASDTESFDISNRDQQRIHGMNQTIGQDIWDRLAGQFELQVR
ncbi:MAG: MbnP family protein [Lewinella sp.]